MLCNKQHIAGLFLSIDECYLQPPLTPDLHRIRFRTAASGGKAQGMVAADGSPTAGEGKRQMAVRQLKGHSTAPGADCVVRRLAASAPLGEQDVTVIRDATRHTETRWVGSQLLAEGEPVRRPRYLVSGWACWRRELPDGRRQIFGFVLPGDGIGMSMSTSAPSMFSVAPLTTVNTVDATTIRSAATDTRQHGALARAIDHAASIEIALLLNHIVRLGRLTALARTAHLLLELHQRLSIVGLASNHRLPLPITQEVLADALGLSSVHLNRTLQQLRRQGLVEIRSGCAILLQPEALAAMSDFEPLTFQPPLAQNHWTDSSGAAVTPGEHRRWSY